MLYFLPKPIRQPGSIFIKPISRILQGLTLGTRVALDPNFKAEGPLLSIIYPKYPLGLIFPAAGPLPLTSRAMRDRNLFQGMNLKIGLIYGLLQTFKSSVPCST